MNDESWQVGDRIVLHGTVTGTAGLDGRVPVRVDGAADSVRLDPSKALRGGLSG
jgi:hypothetical protein